MPKLVAVIVVLLFSSLLSFLPAVRAEEPATVPVSILPGATNLGDGEEVAPNPVYVRPGDTVIWTNHDAALHAVAFGDPAGGVPILDFNLIAPGKSFSRTFDSMGTFDYYCVLHPFKTSTVIVGDERSPKLNISVATDKNYYEKGENIVVTGKVEDIAPGQPVIIQVSNPDDAAYRLDQVSILADGSFNYDLKIGGELGITGTYAVIALYGESSAHASFYLQLPQSQLQVNAVSSDGSALNMWTFVEMRRFGNGAAGIATYTPTPFLLETGKAYPVTVSDYLDSKFSHWEDGTTSRTRVVDLSSNTTLTAHYTASSSTRGFTSLT
ncbi:MAG: plastocyanin/azurin family copper-binding protein, partial [Nitrososphaera sp.]